MKLNRVENYINEELKKYKKICFALLDSENFNDVSYVAKRVESLGASAILVGGSSAIDQIDLDKLVLRIKSIVSIPVILFPGNVTGVSPNADAILFTSLLNSEDPYFISGAQALGALLVKKYNIEPLPTGYIIIGENTTAWFVGRAKGIPFEKNKIAVMYSLAAQYLGMRFVYLEAGS
ncbi:MAG TPA: phosphoglycerol geranylgeranyltransferase, partial [Phototrophicaceae bacterium]|nr:phosphoglycerol geranylgeranyltransferase [Phototrophicaceae bacterium]